MRILEEIFLMIAIVIIAFLVSFYTLDKFVKPECIRIPENTTTNQED